MNKLTRLTALLLALLMIFSTIATAESYPVGSMTQEQWAELVKQAEDELYSVQEGGNNVVERPLPEPLESKPYQNTYDDVKLSDGAAEMTTADLAIVKSDVAGQWQIAIGEDAIQWVNLAGETSATLNVTAALLAGSATKTIRQVVDGEVIGTMVFIVTEPVVVMSLDVAAREGTSTEDTTTTTDSDNVMTLEEANTSTTATFTIEYLYDNGDMAADPHSATQPINFTMTLSQANPPIVGYKVGKVTINGTTYENLPVETTDGISVTENQVSLSSYKLAADLTIVVTYVPAMVNYTIKYYFEPVDGGKHVEDATIKPSATDQELTGSIVDIDPDKTLPGFTLLYYDKPEIAADGSTVVNVYYNRAWYLMSFDMGGGYGVEPIYAKYGAPITVGTPNKAGYVFQGWSLDGTTVVDTPTTMPNQNTTYIAVWKAEELAKVSVVIWGENPNDNEYAYIKSSEFYAQPGETVTFQTGNMVCGYDTEHTHTEDCYDCGQVTHTHSAECCQIPEHTHAGTTCCSIPQHTHNATCCSVEEHAHVVSCFDTSVIGTAASAGTNAPSNPADGYIYRKAWTRDEKVIYINGTWYSYTGDASSGSTVATTCGKTEHDHTSNCDYSSCTTAVHTHGDGNCDYTSCPYTVHAHGDGNCVYCSTPEHTHLDTCLSCEEYEHVHTSTCYIVDPAMDSNLWTYEKSDTVTVAADGTTVMNVYYKRTKFTLTFSYDWRNSKYNKTETINDKWGADISDEYVAIQTNAGSSFWHKEYTPDNWNQTYTNYFEIMPQANEQYYNRGQSGDTGTMTYYGETLNSNGNLNTNSNYAEMFSVSGVGGYSVTAEDRYTFEGFTYHHGTSDGSDCAGAKFYYSRNSYNLVFNNGYEDVKTESVKYEASLATYASYTPELPTQIYEAGSRRFIGWYQNPECSGEQFDLTTHKMPAKNLILYAKWELVDHNVTFYISYEAAAKHGTTDAVTLVDTFQVTHRELVPEANIPVTDPEVEGCIKHPTDPDNYEFDGWFYMDGDVEKPYTKEMPVIRDLVIYAKWKTTQVQSFTVRYVYVDENGNELAVIADEKTGEGLVGTEVTFNAKTGADLDSNYQEGYFPLVPSHSITISETAADNVYTFEYVHKASVPYTVYYIVVDENGTPTGEQAYDPQTVLDNKKAAVTEKFLPKAGYISWDKQYQKTLTVAANGQPTDVNNNNVADYVDDPETTAVEYENVIFFYYYADPTQSPYFIKHMLQNADGSGYTEYEPDTIIGTGTHTHTYGDDINAYSNYEFEYAEVKYLDGSNKTERLTKVDTTPNVSYQLPEGGMEILIYYKLSVSTLTITKTVEGAAPATDTFDITVTFTPLNGETMPATLNYTKTNGDTVTDGIVTLSDNKAVLTGVKNGDEIVLEGIIIGTGYKVEETAKAVYYADSYQNETGTIVGDGTAQAAVTNTYQTGSLTISKKVEGETAPAEDVFTFTVTLPAGTYSYTKGETTGEYTFAEGAHSIELKHDESVTISGIPANTTYTVTETPKAGYTVNDNGTITGTIPVNTVATAAFVNTYQYGDLIIKKQVENAGDQSFIFEVTGPNGYTCMVTIQGAGSVTLADLEPGDYTVTEKTDWSYRFNQTSAVGNNPAKVGAGNTTQVTFTNSEKGDQWLHDEGAVTNTFRTN